MGHLSACGSKIARKIESTVTKEVHGEEYGGGGKLASLAYYGSRYYRGSCGISSVREVAKEFSFGTPIVAMRERERKEKNPYGEIGYSRYFVSRMR